MIKSIGKHGFPKERIGQDKHKIGEIPQKVGENPFSNFTD
jgi:hypothetical protein